MNYVMFDPVYQKLRDRPDVNISISTGRYRKKPVLGWLNPKNPEFRNENVFGEFDIDPEHLIKTSRKDERPYDVYVSSNQDSKMQPPNSKVSVQIYHGVSFRNFAVTAGYLRFDKLFFPGRYMMEKYIEQGILEPGDPRIELMGMPKVDQLLDGTYEKEKVLRGLGLDPSVPTVLWCPTGARHNSFETLGRAGMDAIQNAGFNLIVKLHDHPHLAKGQTREEVLSYAREGLGERGRLEDRSDVAPLLVAADLLVTDASSVAYEFCLLDRPIIFVDVPKLLAARAGMEGSAMDTASHGRRVGRIVDGAEELGRSIGEELASPGRLAAERKAAAEHIFHEPGTATRRMAERLVELARGQ